MTPPAAALWDAWRVRRQAAAFDRLVRPHLPALIDCARRQGLGTAAAEDAVQDALVELARHRTSRPAEVGVAAWLMRSVSLRARTLRRSAARRRRHEAAAAGAHEARGKPTTPATEVEGRVEAALAELAEGDRQVLLFRFLYDLDYREIACVLGISESACRVRVHRAMKRLRSRLGDQAVVLVGALPLDEADGASRWITAATAPGTHAGGSLLAAGGLGMGMAAKVALGTAVVIAVVGVTATVVWWGSSLFDRGTGGAGRDLATVSERPVEVPAPPSLAGRPAPPGPEQTPAPAPAPAAAQPVTMDRLLADIRAHATPEFWARAHEPAVLEGRNGIVIARAPLDVQAAIDEYLDRRRADLAVATVPPKSGGPDVRRAAAAREALRRLLRQVLSRETRLRRAVDLLREEQTDEALALLDELLAEEPDNRRVGDLREQLTGEGTDAIPLATIVRRVARDLRATSRKARLLPWLEGWPSEATWEAVVRRLEDAGRDALTCRGPALRDVLRRGSITLDVDDVALPEVLREIQIQTFVNLAIDRLAPEGLWAERVRGLQVVDRPLREVLDRLLGHLLADPELSWDVNPRRIRLRGSDTSNRLMIIRYIDVQDLLEGQPLSYPRRTWAPIRYDRPVRAPPPAATVVPAR